MGSPRISYVDLSFCLSFIFVVFSVVHICRPCLCRLYLSSGLAMHKKPNRETASLRGQTQIGRQQTCGAMHEKPIKQATNQETNCAHRLIACNGSRLETAI